MEEGSGVRIKIFYWLITAILLACGPLSASDYVIDTEGGHAFIQFRISHLGYSWLTGRFNRFTGEFSYDGKAPEAAVVSVEIDTASIDSNHAERDKHLRDEDYLDVTRFPKARFVSTGYRPTGEGKGVLIGDLTLRGITLGDLAKRRAADWLLPFGGASSGPRGASGCSSKPQWSSQTKLSR